MLCAAMRQEKRDKKGEVQMENEFIVKAKIIAIKLMIFCIFGISTLPLIAVILQFIDSFTNFSGGRGYYTNYWRYLLEDPLIFILIAFCAGILGSVLLFVFNRKYLNS